MRVKNWEKFQHYKHRDPPWIRLYRGLLNDVEWHNLSGDDAKSLVMIWVIASEKDGLLPDAKGLAFRLRISEKRCASTLASLAHWLVQDASAMLAERKQDATPETDSTEKKEEEIYSASAQAKVSKIRPEAHDLSDSCLLALGFDRTNLPANWYGLPWQIEMMLARGYDPPNILATFAKLGGQKPLKPMNYFVKAVESSQQNQIKPAGAPSAKSGNVVQAIDKLVQHLAYFDQPAPDEAGVCSGAGQAPLRLVPPGRRQ